MNEWMKPEACLMGIFLQKLEVSRIFFMLTPCLHISVSSALMHHLSITHLMSIWIPCVFIAHSLHIGPLSFQVFCTHFRRYWRIPFWQLSVLRSKQLRTSSFRFFIYGQLWIRKGFSKSGRNLTGAKPKTSYIIISPNNSILGFFRGTTNLLVKKGRVGQPGGATRGGKQG